MVSNSSVLACSTVSGGTLNTSSNAAATDVVASRYAHAVAFQVVTTAASVLTRSRQNPSTWSNPSTARRKSPVAVRDEHALRVRECWWLLDGFVEAHPLGHTLALAGAVEQRVPAAPRGCNGRDRVGLVETVLERLDSLRRRDVRVVHARGSPASVLDVGTCYCRPGCPVSETHPTRIPFVLCSDVGRLGESLDSIEVESAPDSKIREGDLYTLLVEAALYRVDVFATYLHEPGPRGVADPDT